jgi:hypothetical protein
MSEDNYAYEEEQERKALLQSLHGPMKAWYNGEEAAMYVCVCVCVWMWMCRWRGGL